MSRQINLTEENYAKLEKLKDVLTLPKKRGAKKGVSFNAVIEELMSAYWNPAIKGIWLLQVFSEFQAKLHARGLSSDETAATLERLRGKILVFGKTEV